MRSYIISLIRFHMEHDEENFTKTAEEAARYFIEIVNWELAELIYAQLSETGTMTAQDK